MIFIIIVLILAALPSWPVGRDLNNKLGRLISPYGERVGITFIDLATRGELSINGSREFPAASVAKVAVMAAAYHLADSSKLNLEQKVLFKESDKLEGSGVLRWMRAGRLYTLRNLIRLMIILSDNTATKMVIDTIGLPTINHYIRGINLSETIIGDPTMLRELPSPTINLTSPADMAHLLARIKSGKGFSKSSSAQMLSYMRKQRYRWGIWRGVPGGTAVADKTGNLEGVLNDVGIVYTKHGNYVLSIFTRDFAKKSEARKLINEISRVVYEEYTGEKVEQKTLTKRRLRHPPSGKSPPRLGRRGLVLNRK